MPLWRRLSLRGRLLLLLFRRKSLVQFFLARIAGTVRPDHRLRIATFSGGRTQRQPVLIHQRPHAVGVDLVANPDKAMDLEIATKVLVEGMIAGWFTGKKLSMLADGCYATEGQFKECRVIINGRDKDALIASYAETFQEMLRQSGMK